MLPKSVMVMPILSLSCFPHWQNLHRWTHGICHFAHSLNWLSFVWIMSNIPLFQRTVANWLWVSLESPRQSENFEANANRPGNPVMQCHGWIHVGHNATGPTLWWSQSTSRQQKPSTNMPRPNDLWVTRRGHVFNRPSYSDFGLLVINWFRYNNRNPQ